MEKYCSVILLKIELYDRLTEDFFFALIITENRSFLSKYNKYALLNNMHLVNDDELSLLFRLRQLNRLRDRPKREHCFSFRFE